ncbi:hypothetical protein IV203_029687 [Nitzschia inconspicua]|uniref:Uncharacterized protein n=1 Tax=Nitzschia inconspicua TaxID=303405 RepID=A0A9K3Q0L6_9STRA|nr:hypothetical protein IV203_029687 [Nitzschia inconspicua]
MKRTKISSSCRTSKRWEATTVVVAALRKNVELPLLDLVDRTEKDVQSKDQSTSSLILTPLPSSNFPDQLATPFLYGLQVDTPLHKLILEEATSMALTAAAGSINSSSSALSSPQQQQQRRRQRPMYGQLVWKNGDSLVGAIGCTAEILVNAPTRQAFEKDPQLARDLEDSTKINDDNPSSSFSPAPSSLDGTPPNTVLCRGGYRFVVKEVVKTIPFPVVIVDEIEDDADEDDSDMFFSVKSTSSNNDRDDDDNDGDDDDDDDDDDDELSGLPAPELIRRTMLGVQSVISARLDDAIAKNNLSPLEKFILDSGLGSGAGGGTGINPAAIELAHAEEMAAVWEVFQTSLVDDIEPKDRRFSVAIMAAELTDMNNDIRKQILLTRNSEERLRIVLRELNEIDGMAKAKKIASQITDQVDELDKDLKVGKPQLPKWALQITKGTKIEYFWNEEYGWCKGEVIDEPVTVVDEILLTIRFEDGEIHKLPLMAEEKVRWRPG